MNRRVVINAEGSILAAVLAAFVFGGIAVFGLWLVWLAVSLGKTALWTWIILGLSCLFLWAVLFILWDALGVVLILRPAGLRKVGVFRGRSVSADGVRLGFLKTMNFAQAPGRLGTRRPEPGLQLWGKSAQGTPVMLWEGLETSDSVGRIVEGARELYGVEIERLHLDPNAVLNWPDMSHW